MRILKKRPSIFVKKDNIEDFIKDCNKKIISEEFIKECKETSKLFLKR